MTDGYQSSRSGNMYGKEAESNSINVSDITSMGQMPTYFLLIHFKAWQNYTNRKYF